MAAKTTALSIILIVSLLSHSTTKTVATFVSPLTIPSCCGRPDIVKCFMDYKAAYGAKAAAEAGLAAAAMQMALNAVNGAKGGCEAALTFFKNMKGGSQSGAASTCTHTFEIAVQSLGQASAAMQGKADLSKSVAVQVQQKVQVAAKSVLKCTNGNKSPEVKNAAGGPIALCNVALNLCKGLAA